MRVERDVRGFEVDDRGVLRGDDLPEGDGFGGTGGEGGLPKMSEAICVPSTVSNEKQIVGCGIRNGFERVRLL